MGRNKKKSRRKQKISGIWILIMSVFIAELFFYTWCRVQNVRVGYEMSKQKAKYRNLLMLQNNLKVERAYLKSPERLSGIARHRFNLSIPTSAQIIVVP